jgi:2-polyprenyl-6-methoxyphenol hydroxylase-like FAD-dependent oxidoreductase
MTEGGRTADVVIVGAGPVGLAAAEMLGDAGVSTVVLERNPSTTTHPRAPGVHGRTMEIFRQWGLADAVREGGLPLERSQGFGWLTALAGIEIGSLRFAELVAPVPPREPGPEGPCFCPQPHYEQVLLNGARRHASVTVAFDRDVLAVREESGAVEVEVRPRGSDSPEVIRAQYLLAADGAGSQIRSSLAFGESGLPSFGRSLHIHFRADLSAWAADKPYMLMWIVNADTQGTLAAASRDYTEWTYNVADPERELTTADLEAEVRAAVGVPGLAVEVLDVLRWDYEQLVSDTWRRGRVFLLGDAAHRFPPHGAFGMNSGVQDAQNLAWKLAVVLRGAAHERLLDTYETERKPVAEANGRQSVLNARSLDLVNGRRLTATELASIEKPEEGRAIRERLRAAIAGQAAHIQTDGQQFGVSYESDAVCSDGREPTKSTIAQYVESGSPGARAPHVWLKTATGELCSTVDLLGRNFVLLAGDAGPQWRLAAGASAAAASVRLVCHEIAPGAALSDGDRSFCDVYGISSSGSVIVRPDGYILARFTHAPADLTEAIDQALAAVLGPSADRAARISREPAC